MNGVKNIVSVRHSVRRGVEDRRGKKFGRSQLFHVTVCLRGKPVIYCPLDRKPGGVEENDVIHFMLPLTATHQVEFHVDRCATGCTKRLRQSESATRKL